MQYHSLQHQTLLPLSHPQLGVVFADKMWSTGEGNGKPLLYACLENPMNSMKRQKDRTYLS